MRFFIELSYNGKYYHGWQIQKKVKSVEEKLEYCLSKLLSTSINIIGAGRTDKGVHARQMFAHFDFEEKLDSNLTKRLNIFLPKSIHVINIFPVKKYAHARFHALSRTYKYYLISEKNPFIQDFSWYYIYPLDFIRMNKASKILMRYKNFSSFCKKRKDRKSDNICEIYYAHWSKYKTHFCFTIQANRFLRNMVRSIIGTLVDIGRSKISINEFIKILELENPIYRNSQIAPPYGLFLTKIIYPEDIFYDSEKK
ncbi:tRNA pseudouridine(38-40) synthase TruA [Blattabacterium cuenoti]|uniref:tRNA pseudouridine(38-40) synthase TruA n=1 Tax=Blattabacterium cuenoti TaxID=1653831 RepID=UPI00163BE32C|nr:tRNA pseudouridine(38-40) synthase TruA [Blattabacterium cuenoti]